MKNTESYKTISSLSARIFYCILFPVFLIWLSFQIDIGKFNLPNLFGYVVGLILIVYGLCWYVGTNMAQFKLREKSSLDDKSSRLFYLLQLTPLNKLITTGIYSKSRNPMFFGYTILLVGIGVMLRSISFLILFIPIIILFELLWIKLEEIHLKKMFGDNYLVYKRRTPLIIPSLKNLF